MNFRGDDPTGYPISHCEKINDPQYQELQRAISEGSTWTPANNCSAWAVRVYEHVTGTGLDSTFLGVSTPSELGDGIMEANDGEASNYPSRNYPTVPAVAQALDLVPTVLPDLPRTDRRSSRRDPLRLTRVYETRRASSIGHKH